MSEPAVTSTASERDASQRGYARYALGVLFIVMMLNFLDRQIIAILAEPVKRDLQLSDTQVGLMSGLSFALFYTTLGVPIALLADRWHRSRIIAISIAVWSAMTIFCGLAANFLQLFLARIGVGIGEAGSGPASHSLIADLFPPERRASAFGVYGMAVPIGAFIAYAGGGWLVETVGWRVAFFVAGAPGVAIAALVWLTVRESRSVVPLREVFAPDPSRPSLREALPALSGKAAYWNLVAAGALVQFVAYGFASFYGGFFVRIHGMGYAELGWKLGLMVGLSGAFGAWIGGRVGDRLARLSPARPLTVNALFLIVSTPIMAIGLFLEDPNLALVLFAAPTFAATYYYGTTFAAVQSLARDETRAIAVALFLLISSLIGIGAGPVFVGIVSDALAGADPSAAVEAHSLRVAIAVLSLFNVWAGLHFWLAGRTIARDAEP
ncbi:MAG: MFS transporter [Pseudomonadota bacterium]